MAKVNKKIFGQPVGGDVRGQKRAVVFCMDHPTGWQIVQQLEKKNLRVWLVQDERNLLAQLDVADPEVILMEINAPTLRLLDTIVAEVFAWMRARARVINRLLDSPSQYLWQHAKVILFKSENEVSATGSLAAEIADTDDIVRACSLWGDVKYIGLYSPLSFMSKLRPFWE